MQLVHGKLAAALGTWCEVSVSQKEQARLVGGGIRRLLNRRLTMAWNKWRSSAAEMKQQEMIKRQTSLKSVFAGPKFISKADFANIMYGQDKR